MAKKRAAKPKCRGNCRGEHHGKWCLSYTPRSEMIGYWFDIFAAGMWRCMDCYTELPISEFYLRRNGPKAGRPLSARCKAHYSEFLSTYKVKYQYGISWDDIVDLYGDSCAICGTTDPGQGTRMMVDHNRACCPTSKSCGSCVRGLLCTRCNVAIAMFQDDPERMIRAAGYVSR